MNEQEIDCRGRLLDTRNKIAKIGKLNKADIDDLLLLLHESADLIKMRVTQ